MADSNQSAIFPVLPLRDTVVFPKMIVPLFVGREKSIKALQAVQEKGGAIVLACQKKAALEDPKDTDIYHVGTMGNILQMLKLPDGTVKVLIEGLDRVQIEHFDTKGEFITATIHPMIEDNAQAPELEVLSRAVISEFEDYVRTSKRVSPDVITAVHQIEDMSKLIDTIASHLTLKIEDKQSLLEAVNLSDRFEKLLELMNSELAMMEIENKIKTRVKKQMEKSQKEYYLNEQMKAIQKELSDGEEDDEVSVYTKKIEKIKFSKEAKEKALASRGSCNRLSERGFTNARRSDQT